MQNNCHISNQHPPIYQNTKFHAKEKIVNLVLKTPDLGIFGMKFWKTIALFEISTLEVFKSKVLSKTKKLRPKISYLGILVGIRKKLLSYLIPPRPNLSKMQSFVQNKKCSKSEMPYTGIFEMQFWKTIVIFEINTLQYFRMHSFLEN